MSLASMIDMLKPHVKQAILHGDFLVSTNKFSDVWISDFWQNREARVLIRDILKNFWRKYLEHDEGTYLLASLILFAETSQDLISTNAITREVVDLVNNPRLDFKTVFVDSDSFEIFLEDCPQNAGIILFVEPSILHDLLVVVCQNLRTLGYTVKGIMTPIEREQTDGATLRNALQIDLIPFLVYEEQKGTLRGIVEIEQAPYTRYHRYFLS